MLGSCDGYVSIYTFRDRAEPFPTTQTLFPTLALVDGNILRLVWSPLGTDLLIETHQSPYAHSMVLMK